MPRFPIPSIALLAAALACSNGNAANAKNGAGAPNSSAPDAAAKPTAPPTVQPAAAPARDSLTDAADRGRIAGKESAPVWFVMVSDFQCPYCKAWHDSTYHMIQKEYVETGKIRMAFINFPLHANSLPASVTAMCAATEGKFWETHDRIFDTQNMWKGMKDPRPYLDSLALASGVNAAKLKSCETGKHVEPLIAADQARFQKAGVGGTPTFYVGNATMVGALPPKEFRHVIDSVLAATNKGK
jgi:protein-disulfide isomerase